MKQIDTAWLDTHEWMLRSSNDGVSYGGFKWKREGAWNIAPDWNTEPECGGGFHGNAPEAHGYGFDWTRLELHETRGERIAIGNDKIKVRKSRAVAYGAEIPPEAFERCGMKVARDGDTISPKFREVWVVLTGAVTVENQSGGCCGAYDHATLNAENQSDGDCYATGHATLNAGNQRSGSCFVYGHATLNTEGQRGGGCWARHHATLNAKNMRGGECEADDRATLNVENQSGGICFTADHATLNVKGLRGAACLKMRAGLTGTLKGGE